LDIAHIDWIPEGTHFGLDDMAFFVGRGERDIDAVRPVTFGYLPVYRKPQGDAEWNELSDALSTAGALGIDEYERVRDELIERVITAKLRRLATIDPGSCSVADWNLASTLDVLSIHDTMNHTARPDGAVCLERPVANRLPAVVAMSNRGDGNGDVVASDQATLRDETGVPTMDPAHLRAIGQAYRMAFDAWGPDDVAYNRPYIGGHETTTAGPMLRAIEPLAVVRPAGDMPRQLRLGAWQNEFLREFLLGRESVDLLMQPGTDWVLPPDKRVDWLAGRLHHAHTWSVRGVTRSRHDVRRPAESAGPRPLVSSRCTSWPATNQTRRTCRANPHGSRRRSTTSSKRQ
jgi:hypothetical protein